MKHELILRFQTEEEKKNFLAILGIKDKQPITKPIYMSLPDRKKLYELALKHSQEIKEGKR